MVIWALIISFIFVLIGFGQAKAGKRWGAVLYYTSLVPFGLSLGNILASYSNGV